ncbi:hypothetical protein TIFTF001_015196 [Ficus carica]|uniref:Uncharacterized protein n=1 Tax=Ficus carica TaxID=3494 RepID=A0AA88D6C0_FICCA|nr:hypothetical protein TIFTF001_015196 [Ficus carica]
MSDGTTPVGDHHNSEKSAIQPARERVRKRQGELTRSKIQLVQEIITTRERPRYNPLERDRENSPIRQ